uniref:Nucleoside triphosphate pyrophosphohydrolase n=1 Tax=Dulem virus 30 TaxID=3145748 RepID=A0AAU8B640_9CAUD
MVDCRECRYYKEAIIRDWDGDTIKERKYCNAHDNAIILKTVYSECKVWTSKEGKADRTKIENLKNKIKTLEEKNLKLKEENKELQLIREEKNKDTLNRLGIQEEARFLNKVCEHNFDLLATIAMEEMAELTQVLSKIIRNSNTSVACWSNPHRANFIEEIADVQLCLERIKDWSNITESEVNTIILEKINRTIKRMGIK